MIFSSYPQWQLDCLACLLKLICQFAVDPSDLDLAYHDVFAWSGIAESHRKRTWPGKSRKAAGDHAKGLHIPRLTEVKYKSHHVVINFICLLRELVYFCFYKMNNVYEMLS